MYYFLHWAGKSGRHYVSRSSCCKNINCWKKGHFTDEYLDPESGEFVLFDIIDTKIMSGNYKGNLNDLVAICQEEGYLLNYDEN